MLHFGTAFRMRSICCLILLAKSLMGKALVKAFDKLQMVLAENSGYCGSKYSRWTSGSKLLGASSLPSMNAV